MEVNNTKGSYEIQSKPAYEMLERHPDWVPSLHLGHTEVKARNMERFNRRKKRQQAVTGNTLPATQQGLADQRSEMDEAAPPGIDEQRSEMDEPDQRSEIDEAAPPDKDEQRSEMDEAAPPHIDEQRSEMDEAAQRSEGIKNESTEEVVPHKKRNSVRPLRKKENNWEGSCDTMPSTASGLGELALAAELMEECQQRIQQAFQNDHSGLALPSDPTQLCGLVQNLTKERHWQDETLLTLQKVLKAKDSQLQEKRKMLSEQRLELLKVKEDLARSRKQLEERTETLHWVVSKSQVTPPSRPIMFTVKTLCRGSVKWLRFYTGIKSYARFKALLAFLQGTNGCALDWKDQEENERSDEEEEEGMSEKEEHMPAAETTNPTHQESDDDSSTASVWSCEETAETVRLRLLGTRRGQDGKRHALSSEDQLLLVLSRLRLGLLTADLAFRFQVCEATVSRIWIHWVELLQRKLQQIPVRCSPRYVSSFQPKHVLSLVPGRELTVLECADLLCDSSKRERLQMIKKTHSSSDGSHTADMPYRFLLQVRACAVASPDGFLGFCSSTRLDNWQEWMACQEKPKPAPLALPAFVTGGKGSEPIAGMPFREVLSIKSLTDQAMKYHYLRVVHPHRSETLLDQAWEVCCYLACLLHQPMGLR
ncbi:uncharacterized protein [Hoplias malabaricus]|uniref:uncharacterized protein isoform X2 n=1 Tax=Hoplias malabaricus TaxID=27720 RepID=UPI003463137E